MKEKHASGIPAYSRMIERLRWNYRIRAVRVAFLIGSLALYSSTWAQLDCVKLLDQAEDQYYQGHFDEAIQMAESCLTRRDLPEDLEIRAHKIIAKASVSKRHVDRAKEELRKILEIDPKVTLDPDVEPPQVIRLFEEVRKEKEKEVATPPPPLPTERRTTPPGKGKRPEIQEKDKDNEKGWFARNWYIVAGGAVAAGVGVAVLGGGGGGTDEKKTITEPLAGPPPFP